MADEDRLGQGQVVRLGECRRRRGEGREGLRLRRRRGEGRGRLSKGCGRPNERRLRLGGLRGRGRRRWRSNERRLRLGLGLGGRRGRRRGRPNERRRRLGLGRGRGRRRGRPNEWRRGLGLGRGGRRWRPNERRLRLGGLRGRLELGRPLSRRCRRLSRRCQGPTALHTEPGAGDGIRSAVGTPGRAPSHAIGHEPLPRCRSDSVAPTPEHCIRSWHAGLRLSLAIATSRDTASPHRRALESGGRPCPGPRPQRPAGMAACRRSHRARARCRSRALSCGGVVATSAPRSEPVAALTASTARSNAAWLTPDGRVMPLIFRTYWSAAARTSSGPDGGS
jgi:hypothetical protein